MGSTFKAFTIAMGLDYGTMTLNTTFDATKPLYIGGFTIHDFHGTRRVLTVDEVFVHSSNIGCGPHGRCCGDRCAQGLPAAHGAADPHGY